VNGFTPTIGQTFTVLTAGSVTGTYTNTTIAINSSEHYVISYTSNSVVLTVVSGPASQSSSAPQAVSQVALATKPVTSSRHATLSSKLQRGPGAEKARGTAVLVAGMGARSGLMRAGGDSASLRVWEHVPSAPSWTRVPVVTTQVSAPVRGTAIVARSGLQVSNNSSQQGIAVRAPLAGWMGGSNLHRAPVKIQSPSLVRMRY